MTRMLVLAHLVLVLAVVLVLVALVALRLVVVVLELGVALKEEDLVQQQVIHVQRNCGAFCRMGTHSACPLPFEAFETFEAPSGCLEQIAVVVARYPNTFA